MQLIAPRDPHAVINGLKEHYELKDVEPPKRYLGADIVQLDSKWSKQGICWGISSKSYCVNIVKKFKELNDLLCQAERNARDIKWLLTSARSVYVRIDIRRRSNSF